MFRRQRPVFEYARIQIPRTDTLSADQLLLLGEIRAMEERVIQRQLWSASSVRELLQSAADAAVAGNDPVKARTAFEKAVRMFENDVQTKNRLFYLVGAGLGIVTIAILTWVLLTTAKLVGATSLAKPDTIMTLFSFAGLGSIASVLSRLSTIDLKDELRKKWVVVSAGTRPLLAIAYASVVYVILNNKLVSIQGFHDGEPLAALIWVAAFLCGFSERFAADLLDRMPFTQSSTANAQPK
jgi:hypothetical protein